MNIPNTRRILENTVLTEHRLGGSSDLGRNKPSTPDCVSRDMVDVNRKMMLELRRATQTRDCKVTPDRADAIYQRLMGFEEKREQHLSQLKIERMVEDREKFNFTPEILTRAKREKSGKELDNRIDEIIREKQDKVDKLRIEDIKGKESYFLENCTFQPKINKESKATKPKVADIETWKKKLQDRLFEEYFEQKKIEPAFTPAISKNSQKIMRAKTPTGRHLPVEERLYNLSKRREEEAEQRTLPGSPLKTNNDSVLHSKRTVITVDELCKSKVENQRTDREILRKKSALNVRTPTERSAIDSRKSSVASEVGKEKSSGYGKLRKVINPQSNKPRAALDSKRIKSHVYPDDDKENRPANKLNILYQVPSIDKLPRDEKSLPSPSFIEPSHLTSKSINLDNSKELSTKSAKSSQIQLDEKSSSPLDKEETRLFDRLRMDTDRSYNLDHLTSVCVSMLGNPASKRFENFLPRDRVRKEEGKQYLLIGDTKIFYQEEDLNSIINFGMRSRLGNNASFV